MPTAPQTVDSVYFAGDPHGVFDPLNRCARRDRPNALVLLGDYDLDVPLDRAVAPASEATEVYWIHGNHDVDRESYYTSLFESELTDRCIHGSVVDIHGLRIAGLGGHFQGRIWHPDENNGAPRFARRKDYLKAVPRNRRWRDGLPLKARAAIWWEDFEVLWDQAADILVSHEAPSCHPMGFRLIDDLALAMGAHTIVHGHHHVGYTFRYRDEPLTAIGVGLAGVTSGAGRMCEPGQRDWQDTPALKRHHRQGPYLPAGDLRTIEECEA